MQMYVSCVTALEYAMTELKDSFIKSMYRFCCFWKARRQFRSCGCREPMTVLMSQYSIRDGGSPSAVVSIPINKTQHNGTKDYAITLSSSPSIRSHNKFAISYSDLPFGSISKSITSLNRERDMIPATVGFE